MRLLGLTKIIGHVRYLCRSHYKYLSAYNKLRKKSKSKIGLLASLRYYFSWYESLKKNRSPLADKVAWVVYSSLPFIKSILKSEMIVFEYGSGGSSLFFAERVRRVISIEHDEKWLNMVNRTMESNNLKNWKGHLVLPQMIDKNNKLDYSNPTHYLSHWQEYSHFIFKNYATYINQYEDLLFDIIMIDGRARPSCFIHAKEKIKPGGYLILDNSERKHYQIVHDILKKENWDKFSFFGPGPYVDYEFWETTIWQKPNEHKC